MNSLKIIVSGGVDAVLRLLHSIIYWWCHTCNLSLPHNTVFYRLFRHKSMITVDKVLKDKNPTNYSSLRLVISLHVKHTDWKTNLKLRNWWVDRLIMFLTETQQVSNSRQTWSRDQHLKQTVYPNCHAPMIHPHTTLREYMYVRERVRVEYVGGDGEKNGIQGQAND